MLQLNTEHKACPRRSLHDPGEAFSYYVAWHQSAYFGVLRLVGALDFTGGVGRETNRQSRGKCRLARPDHASGVIRPVSLVTPSGTNDMQS
jgi:hypothetical protein